MRTVQRLIDEQIDILFHNAPFDIPMCTAMGLDLSCAKILDTMVMAYLLRTEPQSLKMLAWRWCGMLMSSYWEVLAPYVLPLQAEFLVDAAALSVPKCDTLHYYESNGVLTAYTPRAANKKATSINNKLHAGGFHSRTPKVPPSSCVDLPAAWKSHTPLYRVWYNVSGAYDKQQGQLAAVHDVERVLGRSMPAGHIRDVPLDDAVWYASRDADASLRVYLAMKPELELRGLM